MRIKYYLFIIGIILGQTGTGAAVKWHPGHYFTIMPHIMDKRSSGGPLEEAFKELQDSQTLRGMQIRLFWAELETSKDKYNFADIDYFLNRMKKMNKRLVIQVVTKSFSPTKKLVPDYLKASDYEGGVFAYASHVGRDGDKHKGDNIKLWNSNVLERLVKLMKALGDRYNSDSHFEAIGFIESAFGKPLSTVSSAQMSQFYDNMIVINKKTKEAFPNTVVIQELNYPREQMGKVVNGLAAFGGGLSCPDLFPDEPGLNTSKGDLGIYHHFRNKAGSVPIAPTVMQTNYLSTSLSGAKKLNPKAPPGSHIPSISELITFSHNNLKANYIFWTRDDNRNYKHVLTELNQASYKANPQGTLEIGCPSAFNSCNKD